MIGDAARVWAVLVGVDRYRAGPDWTLLGPASDACRYARWLLNKGVPANRLRLLVTPHARARADVDALNLPIRPAEQAEVYSVLTEETPAVESELLFLYWGGHGVIDGADSRRLFCADAGMQDKRNLDLDSLLASLRSDFFPAHPKQLLVVDACQTFAEDLSFAHTLPAQGFPRGAAVPGRQQSVLLATVPGELALNDESRATGLFSDAVLAELAVTGPKEWPPAPQHLIDRLHRRFAELRAAGEVRQTPGHIWYSANPGNEAVIYPSARRNPGPAVALAGLKEISDALLAFDEVLGEVTRQQIIAAMPREIAVQVPYAPHAKVHVIGWIRTCECFVHGRRALFEAVAAVAPHGRRLERLTEALDRWWPEAGTWG